MRYDVRHITYKGEHTNHDLFGSATYRRYDVEFAGGFKLTLDVSRIPGETCVFPVDENHRRLTSHVVSHGGGDLSSIAEWGRLQAEHEAMLDASDYMEVL